MLEIQTPPFDPDGTRNEVLPDRPWVDALVRSRFSCADHVLAPHDAMQKSTAQAERLTDIMHPIKYAAVRGKMPFFERAADGWSFTWILLALGQFGQQGRDPSELLGAAGGLNHAVRSVVKTECGLGWLFSPRLSPPPIGSA